MSILDFLLRAAVRFGGRLRAVGRAPALAVQQRRRRQELDALEAERLDRIRNPSKYLGKS